MAQELEWLSTDQKVSGLTPSSSGQHVDVSLDTKSNLAPEGCTTSMNVGR